MAISSPQTWESGISSMYHLSRPYRRLLQKMKTLYLAPSLIDKRNGKDFINRPTKNGAGIKGYQHAIFLILVSCLFQIVSLCFIRLRLTPADCNATPIRLFATTLMLKPENRLIPIQPFYAFPKMKSFSIICHKGCAGNNISKNG